MVITVPEDPNKSNFSVKLSFRDWEGSQQGGI